MLDNYEIDTHAFWRYWLMATIAFAAFVIIVYIVAYLPLNPNLANPYNMQEWPALRAQYTEQLHSYGVLQVNPTTGRIIAPGEAAEDAVTHYHIPIEEAKRLLVERGLPTRTGE